MEQDEPSQEFAPSNYTRERTAERIRETRAHLRDELLPGASNHSQSTFLVPFVRYLDHQAQRFEESIGGATDHLALATRNLLEFLALLNHVFTNQRTRAEFVGEAFLDGNEISERLARMGIPGHLLDREPPEWNAIPAKRVVVMKDKFDDYFFKLCSKLIHPSAISIMCPDALPGPLVFHFFGLNYLGRSYNFLVNRVFEGIDSPTDEAVL